MAGMAVEVTCASTSTTQQVGQRSTVRCVAACVVFDIRFEDPMRLEVEMSTQLRETCGRPPSQRPAHVPSSSNMSIYRCRYL
eukprot:6172889-Pleurochrysis_carterae.AAC.2